MDTQNANRIVPEIEELKAILGADAVEDLQEYANGNGERMCRREGLIELKKLCTTKETRYLFGMALVRARDVRYGTYGDGRVDV